MQERYLFPAIFSYADDGVSVEFPDLPGCLTCGQTEEEALEMAKEALALHLYGMEVDGEPIPMPSRVRDLATAPGQAVVFVEAWMPPIRSETANRAVKKTLTIPKWLNDLAEQKKVNFSHVLQSALKNHLGIKDHP